jgi:hypothetical protein
LGLLRTRFGKSRRAGGGGGVHRGRCLLLISTSEDTCMARRRTTRTGAGLSERMQRHDATMCGGHLVVLAARSSCAGGWTGGVCTTAMLGQTAQRQRLAVAARRAAHARRPDCTSACY